MSVRVEGLAGEKLRRRLLRLRRKAPLRLKYQCLDCYHLVYGVLTREDLDRLRDGPLPAYPLPCPACGAAAF